VRAQQQVRSIESIPDRGLYLRVIVPVNVLTIADDIRILQVLQRVPTAIALDAEIVQKGNLDYQVLLLARVGLKRIFGLTLTLAMLLTLFSALALAFVLSERLSAPLSALAEATRAIAKGDYSKLNPVKSRDEFGVLTQSFNTMTRQIADATEAMERLREARSQTREILPVEGVRTRAIRLLAQHPLRAADALQLAASLIWCEEQPSTETFVCLDNRLRDAARREGFALFPQE
jgi:HAMP domain-containing protein